MLLLAFDIDELFTGFSILLSGEIIRLALK